MPLLGPAAMVLSFDVAAEAVDEHDDWHTHEHLYERLAIPGFLRGTRWVAWRGQPRYFVLYEVADMDVLTSAAYLARLNDPSPWTSRMMPHYRRMTRGFCSVAGSFGAGLGHACLQIRFRPRPGEEDSLRRWMLSEALPTLPVRPGVGGAHLLEGVVTPAMTREQSLRGTDAGVDWVVAVSGYSIDALELLERQEFARSRLERLGAVDVEAAVYTMAYSMTDRDVDA
jgi:hypothetical protein